MKLSTTIQSGDWKGEKHVPIIHFPESIQANTINTLKVSIGDEIAHPNTLEHHISWIKVFYQAEDSKFPVEIASFNFSAHGEGEILNSPVASTEVSIPKSGVISAISYCNIHGLWENNKEIVVK
jgi:superoxide reductase